MRADFDDDENIVAGIVLNSRIGTVTEGIVLNSRVRAVAERVGAVTEGVGAVTEGIEDNSIHFGQAGIHVDRDYRRARPWYFAFGNFDGSAAA